MNRARVAILFGTGLIGGCIPSRDNPYDSSLVPDVRVEILDYTPPDFSGECPTALGSATAVLSASRGRCLALRAEGEDPQGGTLDYRFEIAGVTAPLRDWESDPVLLLGTSLRDRPAGETILFRVTARDPQRARAVIEVPFLLENTRPIASLDPPRTYPLGGFPWAPGANFSIRFDGQAHDPDGDTELVWCWTLPEASAPSCSGASSIVWNVPSTEGGRFIVKLEVHDGDLDDPEPDRLPSEPAFSTVTLTEPNVWAASAPMNQEPLSASELLDPARWRVATSFGILPDAAYVADGMAVVAYGERPVSLGNILAFRDHDADVEFGVFDGAFDGSIGPTFVGGDEVRRRAWAFYGCRDAADDCTYYLPPGCMEPPRRGVLAAYSLDDPSSVVRCATFDLVFLDAAYNHSFEEAFVVADGAGNAWAGAMHGTALLLSLESGGSTVLDLDGELTALTARPGTNETWSAWVMSGTGAPARVLRHASPSSPPTEIPISGVGAVYALEWVDGDSFWISSATDGLALVDAELFAQTGSIPAAASVHFDGIRDVRTLAVDRETGDAWAYGEAASTAVHVRTDGRLRAVTSALPFRPLFVDPSGLVWTSHYGLGTSEMYGLMPAEILARGRAAATTGVQSEFGDVAVHATLTGLDPYGGGLWAMAGTVLYRVAENGVVLEQIDRANDGGYIVALPELERLRVSADGTAIWGVSAIDGAIVQILLTNANGVDLRPPMLTAVLEPGEPNFAFLRTDEVFAPSARGADPSAFAWVALRNGSVTQIVKLAANGAVTLGYTVPEQAYQVIGASSQTASSDLCFATSVFSGDVQARRLTPAGVMIPAGVVTIGGSNPLISAIGISDDGRCWLGVIDTLYVLEPGVAPKSLVFTDKYVSSVAPRVGTQGVVTATTHHGDPFAPEATYRYIVGNGAGGLYEAALLSPTKRVVLISPSSAFTPVSPF